MKNTRDRGITVAFLLALFLTCCIRPALAQTPGDHRQLANQMAEYDRLRSSGRIDAAAKIAEGIVDLLQRRFPKRYQYKGSMFLGEARYFQGRYKEAIELFEKEGEQLQDFQPQNDAERLAYARARGDSLEGIAVCLLDLGLNEDALPFYEAYVQAWSQAGIPQARLHLPVAQSRLAGCHLSLGHTDQAATLLRQVAAALEPLVREETKPGLASGSLVVALHGLGQIDENAGRYDLAEPKLRRALKLQVAANGWNYPGTARILDSLGVLYHRQNRWRDAEPYYRAALESYEQSVGKDHPETIDAEIKLGRILLNQDRQREAEVIFRRAVARSETHFGSENPHTANALKALAKSLKKKDSDEAESLLREALRIQEKMEGPTDVAETLLALAMLTLERGDLPQSRKLLERVWDILQQNPLPPWMVGALHINSASVLWLSGETQAALAETAKEIEQIELERAYSSGAERERAETFEGFSITYEVAINWHAELNDIQQMFLTMERLKARSFLDELRLKNVDLLAGLSDTERRHLTDREQELRRQLTEAESRFDALPDPTPNLSQEALGRRKAAATDVLRARDALYQHLTDTRAASPAYRELITHKAEPASLPLVQKQLSENELLLAYSIGEFHSYVVVVRPDTARFLPLEVDQQTAAALNIAGGPLTADSLAQLLLDEKQGVLPVLSSPKRHNEDVSVPLAALWKLLIPEAERGALTSGQVKLLTILPDGPLAMLPFETLIVAGEGETQYLLDVGPPIAYAPSASVLLNLAQRERTAAKAKEPVLTLGDPAYPQTGASAPDAIDRRLGVNLSADRIRAGLNRLPYTGWESTWVQHSFEKAGLASLKLTGAGATEAAIRQNAAGREIVHLACHGMADQSYGNFYGSLAIAPGRAGDSKDDGFLSMSEIYELDLTGCELAILSACVTNYGPQQQGEGVWALSRGFLVAGSRRVIASNWVVDDQAGATLVSYFASYLIKPVQDAAARDVSTRDYAAALHTAKKNVRKEEKWRHPFYWSSLVLVGPK